MVQQTAYSHKHALPDFIVRNRTQIIECPVYSGSTLTAPASGTVTIYKGSGSKLVDAQAVTVTADIATYTLTAGVLPTTISLGDDWLIV